jgi:uncharacterized membrane protein
MLVAFLVDLLTNPFVNLVTSLLEGPLSSLDLPTEPHFVRFISQLLTLVFLFVFTLLLGVAARWFFVRTLLSTGDQLIHRIPLVNKVYKTTKEIIQSLFGDQAHSFQQVVMTPFPYNGCYALGFVTGECTLAGSEMVSVFVLTTPNPTTGYLVMRKKSDLIYLDMKSNEAVRYVVSCGVIPPTDPQ